MRIFKRFLLVFTFLIIVVHNCPQGLLINNEGDFVECPVFVDKDINKDYGYLKVDVKIPQINGIEDKEREKVINSEIVNWTEMWIKDVEDIAKEYFDNPKKEKPIFPYQLMALYQVTNKCNLISFYIEFYQYTGGAHGLTERRTYNIDVKSGKELSLADLFKKGYDYKSKINSEINKEISKHPEYYFTGKDGFNGIKDNQSYYIEDGNIIIHFGAYEIAPYASGMPEFKIPIDIFKDNFLYDNI
ncbi:DUF3298 and DUF4163 domain-containing protein [Clostridium carnis]